MALYLVDYENVHDAGLEGVSLLTEQDHLIIFYGINIKSIPFERHVEIVDSLAHVEHIRANKTGKNYLDFQLATYLGMLVGQGEKGPIYIISKDTGYDSVVDFIKNRGLSIVRRNTISENTKAKKTTAKKAQSVTNNDTSVSQNATLILDEKNIVADNKVGNKKDSNAKKEENSKTDSNTKKNNNAQESSSTIGSDSTQDKASSKGKQANTNDVPESIKKKIRQAVKGENLEPSKYSVIYKLMAANSVQKDFKKALVKSFGEEKGMSVYTHIQIIFGELVKSRSNNEV